MRALWLVPLAFLAYPVRAAHPAEASVQAFYAWVLAHPSAALPSAKERARLAKVLSPELLQCLKRAAEAEAQCIKVTPKGDKPLMIEGDVFVNNLEGATEVAYGEPVQTGDTVVVDASLVSIDPRYPKGHKFRVVAWKDQLELRWLDQRWQVQNVRYARGSSLVEALSTFIDSSAKDCAHP